MIKYLAIIIIVLLGCTNNPDKRNMINSSQSGNDTLIHGVEKIRNIIELSHIALDTITQSNLGIYRIGADNERIPGPSDFYLISTFKISFIDTVGLKQINVLKSPLDKNSIYYKEWLPKSVVKGLFEKETFREVPVYSANIFYKSPYQDGFFILQDDSTIYLQMQTK